MSITLAAFFLSIVVVNGQPEPNQRAEIAEELCLGHEDLDCMTQTLQDGADIDHMTTIVLNSLSRGYLSSDN